MQLKERFLNAIISGELGRQDEFGVIVTLKEFKNYFSGMQTGYVNSFLPAAVIEFGQASTSNTKFVFRLRNGIYRVHPQAIADQIKLNNSNGNNIEELPALYIVDGFFVQPAIGDNGLVDYA